VGMPGNVEERSACSQQVKTIPPAAQQVWGAFGLHTLARTTRFDCTSSQLPEAHTRMGP
jgi:hypothetical protein